MTLAVLNHMPWWVPLSIVGPPLLIFTGVVLYERARGLPARPTFGPDRVDRYGAAIIAYVVCLVAFGVVMSIIT